MSDTVMARTTSQIGEYQESRELVEIKGKMFLARQFPRSPEIALQNVIAECQRKELAEAAQYEFPRGDSVVKGPSIRLVEVLARHWGNITSGVTEIDAKNGESTIKAFAWDLETNASDEKLFTVKHERSTRNGTYKLTDERDIYETVANKGARRKRACLLALLPGWYVDAAIEECDKTLAANVSADSGEKMVAAFAAFGITPEQISVKLNKEIDKLSPNDIVKLRHLYSAIKDGFVKPAVAFGDNTGESELPTAEEDESLKALNKKLSPGKEKSNAVDKG